MGSIFKFDIETELWQSSLNLAKNTLILTIVILTLHYFFFSMAVFASELDKNEVIKPLLAEKEQVVFNTLPENPDKEFTVSWTGWYTATAYNSEPGQTDNTPCITANGYDLCSHGVEDTVAANFLRFGTKIRIPEYFGERVFTVRDRMHERYQDRVDIWMIEKEDAKQFGIKAVKIEVLSN